MNHKTMLEVVKRVLSDLNFEMVNSIYETDDALAIARIVLNVHSAILTEYPWVIKDTLIRPIRIDLTTISVGGDVQRIKKVRYNKSNKCTEARGLSIDEPRDNPFGGNTNSCSTGNCSLIRTNSCKSVNLEYFNTDDNRYGCNEDQSEDCSELIFLDLEDFLKACVNEDDLCKEDCPKPNEVEFVVVDDCGRMTLHSKETKDIPDEPIKYKIKINNNKDPEYWTVINGDIVLDSYCFRDGPKIQQGRLQLIGSSIPDLSLKDDQIIDLPVDFFNYFLAELLSTASYSMNNSANEKEEARSQRLRRRLLRDHGLHSTKRTDVELPTGAYWRK